MADSIKNLLQQTVNKAGISQQVDAAVVCDAFNRIIVELLGQEIAKKAKALYVKNRTLSIAVLSSAVGQEIKLHEREIMEKLAKKIGPDKVERLRFLA